MLVRRVGIAALLAFSLAGAWHGTRVLRAADSPADSTKPEDTLFKGMKWRLVGPFRGGRVIAVTGVASEPNVYYFGAVSGGVWKTIDSGADWTPLTDKEPIASVGSIAVPDSDPNVIYVGTGEGCPRGDVTYGDGVWKSLDGGKTWIHLGLDNTETIPRVIVNPHDPNEVFVAALGHIYGPNADRGVYKSTDGGKTWRKVLYKDDKTGAIDLTFDPSNAHVLFAALWQMNRTPYGLTSGGPGSGLYKSTDDGETWKQLEGHGLPKGVWGRAGVAVSGADSQRVYALIEAEDGGLYSSNDGGETWTRVNQDHRFTQRAWYFSHVFSDPRNVDTVYILNTGAYRSTDGGKTFTPMSAPHGDHHGLWINPRNPQFMINGNDGGADVSIDGGKTWSTQENQPTAQFYHVVADNRYPYYIYGAQQDNSTVGIASAGEEGGIGRQDWYPVGGGESGYIAPYPPNPNVVYAGSYDGLITRYDHSNWQEQEVSPWPDNVMGEGAADLKYRFQWTFPIEISPHDPNVIYAGAQVIFKSADAGHSWTVISPDLTRNDRSKQGSSGGPVTQDNTSIEYYDTVFAIAESPVQKGLIWAGSDDGLIHLTRDGGRNWTDVTPKDLPEWSLISIIEPSPHDAGTAYVAAERHRLDDHHPYIYKSSDFGKTWTKITDGIPDNVYVHAVREDPEKQGLLYAGTETGVMVSFDDGAHWQALKLNLPQCPVHDLVVKNGDLAIATHGRAFWILDDLSPLRQFTPGIASESVHLFRPRAAYVPALGGGFRPRGAMGQNPPGGAVIDYELKNPPGKPGSNAPEGADAAGGPAAGAGAGEEGARKPAAAPVKIEIDDSAGHVVRRYPAKNAGNEEGPSEFPGFRGRQNNVPAEKGLNRFTWDLRYDVATRVPGSAHWGGFGGGPMVLPGTYQVKLTVEGQTYTAPLEVKLDPRVKVPRADLEKQLDLALKIRDRVTADHDAVNQIRSVHTQLAALERRLGVDEHSKVLIDSAKAFDKKMTAVEEKLMQTKSKSSEDPLNFPVKLDDRLGALGNAVESAAAAPTEQDYAVFDLVNGQLEQVLGEWRDLRAHDLAAFNAQAAKAGVSVIGVKEDHESEAEPEARR
ncbi:MAG TPA: glycosyl hydrolase [Terriglobia bacterium]|nr:glycosyl hydrolase [Terriglobia bacterium]